MEEKYINIYSLVSNGDIFNVRYIDNTSKKPKYSLGKISIGNTYRVGEKHSEETKNKKNIIMMRDGLIKTTCGFKWKYKNAF